MGNCFKQWHRALGLPNYGIILEIHSIEPLVGFHSPNTYDDFEIIIIVVKAQHITTRDLLVIELECKFSNHELMNALEVIYPKYCLQLDFEFTSRGYLESTNILFQANHENSIS